MHILMLKDIAVMAIKDGVVQIFRPDLMPYGLVLEEEQDLDTRVNNIAVFNNWCSKRILSLDRKYAKQILNTLELPQAITDADRTKVALSYLCLSLQDAYWITDNQTLSWKSVNLFQNHLSSVLVPVSLKGKSITLQNKHLISPDISTQGVAAKAWIKNGNNLLLYKGNTIEKVQGEVYASKIAEAIGANCVKYEQGVWEDAVVSISKCFTTQDIGFVPMSDLQVWLVNQDTSIDEFCLQHFKREYLLLNLIDYLIGNYDRHLGNWGVLVDERNSIVSLAPLFDFDNAFKEGDLVSLTRTHATQREAAIEAIELLELCDIVIPFGPTELMSFVTKKAEAVGLNVSKR